jgi:hypothetical protein
MTFEGKIVRNVGVRYKGSMGAWYAGEYPNY